MLQLHKSPSAEVTFGPTYVRPGIIVTTANAANTNKIAHNIPKVDALTAKAHGLQVRPDKAGILLERIERLYSKKKNTSKYAFTALLFIQNVRAKITHPIQGRVSAIRGADQRTSWT